MSLTLQSTRKLNDGNEIPALGFGVYQSEPGDETEQAVLLALEVNFTIGVPGGYSQTC
jgi:methylglyoxal/glyoxal reductase